MKRISFVLLICAVLLILTSCAFIDSIFGSKDNNVEVVVIPKPTESTPTPSPTPEPTPVKTTPPDPTPTPIPFSYYAQPMTTFFN